MAIENEGEKKNAGQGEGKKTLPTNRLVFEKQLEILRAYGVHAKPIRNKELGAAVQVAETTLSLANGFFVSVGLIRRGEGGYEPSRELIAFARAWDWNRETAGEKLADLFRSAWFGKALLLKTQLRDITVEEAITTLAEAAGAPPEFRSRLALLLDYLATARLIVRKGDRVRSGPAALAQSSPLTPPPAAQLDGTSEVEKPIQRFAQQEATRNGFLVHRFPLRKDVTVDVPLPVDLTDRDVERLKKWLETLPVEE